MTDFQIDIILLSVYIVIICLIFLQQDIDKKSGKKMTEEIKQPWEGTRQWVLSKDRKCPACGSRTQLLIYENSGDKEIIKERCNIPSCKWWQIVSPIVSNHILEKEKKSEKPIKTR